MTHLTRNLTLIVAVTVGTAGHAVAQGIVEGLLSSTSGQAVGGAVVLVSSDAGTVNENGPRIYHGITDEAGRFSIGNILNGRYRVCAVAGGFADPCRWSEGILVTVAGDRKQLRMSVPEGRRLRVAVEDAGEHLPAREIPRQAALLVLELSDALGRRWHLLPIAASGPKTRVYDEVVPAGAKLSLRATAPGLLLQDSHGNRNDKGPELITSASVPIEKAESTRTVPPMFGRATPTPDVMVVLKVAGRK